MNKGALLEVGKDGDERATGGGGSVAAPGGRGERDGGGGGEKLSEGAEGATDGGGDESMQPETQGSGKLEFHKHHPFEIQGCSTQNDIS